MELSEKLWLLWMERMKPCPWTLYTFAVAVLVLLYYGILGIRIAHKTCLAWKWVIDAEKAKCTKIFSLLLYLLSRRRFAHCPAFLLTMVMADCPSMAVLCTIRVIFSICRDGVLECESADDTEAEQHRAVETTEEHAAWLQSYIPFCVRCSHQACATVTVSSLCNCSTCLLTLSTWQL